jgi:protease-4
MSENENSIRPEQTANVAQESAGVETTQGTFTAPVAPSPAPPRKSRGGMFFLGALSGCLIVIVGVLVIAFIVAASQGDSGRFVLSTEKIAIVPIEGEIFESRDTIEAIHRYADNALVKGIVIRINSPGGAIAPSQEIYSEILKTREESGKPIVASLDSVAASGGFYIAAACDQIVANPGSITGSIGVILQWLDLSNLVTWAKMRDETIVSGTMKAAGSPYRTLSPEERNYFQRLVSQLHVQFVKAVAAGRKGKISEADVSRLADGRVFTGEEAHSLKLVDQLGNLDDAVMITARMAGVKGKPVTIYPRRRKPGLLELLSDSSEAEAMIERIITRRAAQFLYKW